MTAFRHAGATTIAVDLDQIVPAFDHAKSPRSSRASTAESHGHATLRRAERIDLSARKADLLILLCAPLALFGVSYTSESGGWRGAPRV